MPVAKKSLSLQLKIFLGLVLVAVLSVVGTTLISFLIIKKSAEIRNETSLQNKATVLFTSLDYAISHANINKSNIRSALKDKLMEIADINKIDVILYSLDGRFIVSNRDDDLVLQKKIPNLVLSKIMYSNNGSFDFKFYDERQKATVTSSYRILRDNNYEPLAIAYFPSYFNNNQFVSVFNRYLQFIVIVNAIAILLSVFISWRISKTITKTISSISQQISNEGYDLKPIVYTHQDELSVLVGAYNRMIYQLREQSELKAQMERDKAWREMAKQVAHEVKNPLTPMKLSIQNFERKFDRNDPNLEEKVKKLSRTMVEQIDLIAKVANAFSVFAKLPERKDAIINLNEEIRGLVDVFNKSDITFHAESENIKIKFDNIYLTRILTNLLTNAQQATVEGRKSEIEIGLKLISKNKIRLTIDDNGCGIPKKKLEQIFEPNFTTKSSGTGLGLTMVRKMIEEYHGSIAVQSEVDKYTRFTIILRTGVDEDIPV